MVQTAKQVYDNLLQRKFLEDYTEDCAEKPNERTVCLTSDSYVSYHGKLSQSKTQRQIIILHPISLLSYILANIRLYRTSHIVHLHTT